MTPRLALRREVLTDLTDDQLSAVVGGNDTRICPLTHPCIDDPPPYSGLRCLLTDTCA